uniref:Uncharacterized protein n=1 Tax=Glossina austeni TaxID=7395 RepID=A0A1A9UZ63_GLOAU
MENPSKYSVVSDKYQATKGVCLELANKDNDGELLEANQEAISSKEFNAKSYTDCDSISCEKNSADSSKTAGSAELEKIENTIEQDIRFGQSTHTKENVECQDFGLYVHSNKCGTDFPNDKKVKNFENSIGMYGLINTLWNTAKRYTAQAISSLTKANTIWNESIKKRIVVKTSDGNLHNGKNFQIFINTSSSSNETRSRSRVNLLELLESTDEHGVPLPAFENIKKYYSTLTITLQTPSKNNQLRANGVDASSINKNLKDGENLTGCVNTIRETTKTSEYRSFYSITKTTTELTEIVKKDTITVNYPEPVRSNAVTTLYHDSNNKKTISITLNALNKTQEETSTSSGAFGNIQHLGKESHLKTTIQVQDSVVSEKGSDFPNENNVEPLRRSTGVYGLFNAVRYTANSCTSCFVSLFKKPAIKISKTVKRSLDFSKPTISSELKIANVNLRNDNGSSPLPSETQFQSKVKLLELLENASEEDTPSAALENIKSYRTAAAITIQSPKYRNDQLNEYDNNNVEKSNSSAGLHGLVNIIRNSANSVSYLSLSSFKKSAVKITKAIKKSSNSTTPTISSELKIANVNLRNEKTSKILDDPLSSLPSETRFRSKAELLDLLENASEKDTPSGVFENIKRYLTTAAITIQSSNDRNDQLNEYDVSVSNDNNVEKPNSSAGLRGLLNITRKAASSCYLSLSSFKKPIVGITEPVKKLADSSTPNTSNKKTFKILDNASSPALSKSRAKVEWSKLLGNADKKDKCSPTKKYDTTTTILVRDHNKNKVIHEDEIDVCNNKSLESTTGLYGLVNNIKKTSYRYYSSFSLKRAPTDVTEIIKESKPDAESSTTAASTMVTALHHGRPIKKTDLNFNNILNLNAMNKTIKESEVEAQENVNKKNPEGQTLDLNGSTYSNDNDKQIAETDMSLVETEPVAVDEVVKCENSSALTMKMLEQQSNDLKESINNNDSSKSAAKTYTSADEVQCTLLDEAVEKDNKFTDSSKTITINSEQQNNDLKENINSNDTSKLIVKTCTPLVKAECTLLDEAVEKDNKFTDSSKTTTINPEHQGSNLKDSINSDDKNKVAIEIRTSAVETECVPIEKAVEKDNKCNDSSKTVMKNPEKQNNQLVKIPDINVTSPGSVEKHTKCENPSKPIVKKSDSRDQVSKETINKKETAKQTATTSTSTAKAESTLASKVYVTSPGSVEKHTKCENPSKPIVKKSDSRDQISKETINKKEIAKQTATTSTATPKANSTLASKVIEKTTLPGTASSQSVNKNTVAKPKCTSVANASAKNKTCQTSSHLGTKDHSKADNKKSPCNKVAAYPSATKTKTVSARTVNTSYCAPVVLTPSCTRRANVSPCRNQSPCSYPSYTYSCQRQGYYDCRYWGGY